MRSNTLIINSKFKPFSYQEMLHPVLMADTAHKELETGFGELQLKSGVWDNLINPDKDARAYQMFSDYSKELQSEADELAAQGLSPQSRQRLNLMREGYGRNIVPIEAAYNTRKEQAAQQQLEWNKDQTIRYNRLAAETSLDDYINNPTLGYRAVSGNVLAGQVAVAAENLRRDISDNPTKYRTVLDGQYIEAIRRNGFTAEEVNAAILGEEGANPILKQAVDNVMQSAGVDDFSEQSRGELRRLASQGLYKAIGDTTQQYLDPWKDKYDYQAAITEAQAVRDHKRALELANIRAGGKGSSSTDKINDRVMNLPITGEGISGEGSKSQEYVRVTEEGGLTTDTLDSLREERAKVEKQLQDLQNQTSPRFQQSNLERNQSLSPRAQAAQEAMHRVYSSPEVSSKFGNNQFNNLRNELNRIDKEMRDIYKTINTAKAQYSHLSSNEEIALNLGLQLDKAQSAIQEQKSSTLYTNDKDVNFNLYKVLYQESGVDLSRQGLFEIDKEGNVASTAIKPKEAEKELLNDTGKGGHEMTHSAISTRDGKIIIGQSGKRYMIKGDFGVDAFQSSYSDLRKISSDFKDEATKNAMVVNFDETIAPLIQSGQIVNTIHKQGKTLSNGMKVIAFRDQESGDIFKFTMTGNNYVMSSLGDELSGGEIKGAQLRKFLEVQDGAFNTKFGAIKPLEQNSEKITGTASTPIGY